MGLGPAEPVRDSLYHFLSTFDLVVNVLQLLKNGIPSFGLPYHFYFASARTGEKYLLLHHLFPSISQML